MTDRRALVAPLTCLALVLTACGGRDGTVAVPGADQPGSDAAVEPSGDGEAVVPTDDAVDELVEDVLEGDTEALEDTLSQFNTGEGGGVVTIQGTDYEFVAEVCIAGPLAGGGFTAEGVGTTPDGQPFYAEVSFDRTERADMEGIIDETMIETMFPDGRDVLEDVAVRVTIGQDGMFAEGPPDQPAWDASTVLGEPVFGATIDAALDGTTYSGSGEIIDLNAVAAGFGEGVPFQFTASCS